MAGCGTIKKIFLGAGNHISAYFGPIQEIPDKITEPYRDDAGLSVLWIGHATLLIQIDDKIILTDPMLLPTAGQISGRLIEPGIDPENLPHIDVVLISHLHIDHLNYGSLDIIEDRTDQLLAPEGGLVYIPNFDYPTDELKRWQSWEKDGLKITATPVKHNGFRYGLDGLWMNTSYTGYMIEYNGKTVYFSGDTGYDPDFFVETGKRFPNVDLAFFPLAPIHPRDYSYVRHTDPKDAIRAFQDLGAKVMTPMHYSTFQENLDTLGEARFLLEEEMKLKNLTQDDVVILDIGEQYLYKIKE